MKLSLRAKNRNRINSKMAVMRKAKERKRMEQASNPLTCAIETIDPLYTLTFADHLIGKEYVFTLHRGNRTDQFKVNVNGVPWKDCGWSDLLAEIRRKRVRIQSLRHKNNP